MLLGLPAGVRILLAREPCDMRNSIDGLAAIVRNGWQEDLFAGHLFVFVSRRGDRLKILTWQAGGFVLTYKRLERGRFRLPRLSDDVLGAQLDATQLALLLDGVDLSHVRRPSKWSPPPTEAAAARGALLNERRAASLPEDHACPWRDEAEKLQGELGDLRRQLRAAAAPRLRPAQREGALGPRRAAAGAPRARPGRGEEEARRGA